MKVNLSFVSDQDNEIGGNIYNIYHHLVRDYAGNFRGQRDKFVCYMHPVELGSMLRFLARNYFFSQLEMMGKDQAFVRVEDVRVYEGYEKGFVFVPDFFAVGHIHFDNLVKKYSIFGNEKL